MSDAAETLRIDKWLWHARFFKSRSLAAKTCDAGRVRLNGERITKARTVVRAGDVLTFPAGPHIRVVRVAALGTRRGPAAEALTLYEDLDPPQKRTHLSHRGSGIAPRRPRGAGRPTKAERRATDRLRGRD